MRGGSGNNARNGIVVITIEGRGSGEGYGADTVPFHFLYRNSAPTLHCVQHVTKDTNVPLVSSYRYYSTNTL